MKALVLGGNGFIGSHVVDRLLEFGYSVRVFDRGQERYRSPLPIVDYRYSAFDDVPEIVEALEGIDVVFHLISTTVPSTSNLDPVADIKGNLMSTVRLLELMVQKNVPKIVFLSSGGTVYGVPEVVPTPEEHPLRPICSYGIVKVSIENYLHMFRELYGLSYTVLRASNPYGERQGHAGVQGVIGTFLSKVQKGEAIEVWGNGGVIRDFIHVKDLAELCVATATAEETAIYNAGSGTGTSIKEILAVIESVTGKSLNAIHKTGRTYDVPEVVLDISKVRARTGWLPRIPLREGIHSTWTWLRDR